ncbi:MAG: hypothetical protein ACKO9F_10920 [Caldilinea sp.]
MGAKPPLFTGEAGQNFQMISAVPFCDWVVHSILRKMATSLFERSFIDYSFAS